MAQPRIIVMVDTPTGLVEYDSHSATALPTAQYASFGSRALAYLIDFFIVVIPNTAIIALLRSADTGPGFTMLFTIALVWVYNAGFESSEAQATPGKKVAGIQVCDLNGQRIGFGRASQRFFFKMLFALPWGLGFWVQPFNKKRQAAHDMVAKTLVIPRRTGVAAPESVSSNVEAPRVAAPVGSAPIEASALAAIFDRCIGVTTSGDSTALSASYSIEDANEALRLADDAVRNAPGDAEALLLKATVLFSQSQFKSAEEVVDEVLAAQPRHFEARMWKDHWQSWRNCLSFPGWNVHAATLHPVMAAHLAAGRRVQIVRDGVRKAPVIVAEVQGPPFDTRTEIRIDWVLSKTPFGHVVAYYLKLIEPNDEPSVMEAFLPVLEPVAFHPMESYFLAQLLASMPYSYVVLASGSRVSLNRRWLLTAGATRRIRLIARELAEHPHYVPVSHVQQAMLWHTNNFDMSQLEFD